MTDQYGDTWTTTYDAYGAPVTTASVHEHVGAHDDSYAAVGSYDAHDTGYGATTYDPTTGAYDQHLDYETPAGRRHHRERVDESGTYRHRDVDRYDDGSTRVHREYDNPNTGTSYHRDYEE
jgi:hypothetical protein